MQTSAWSRGPPPGLRTAASDGPSENPPPARAENPPPATMTKHLTGLVDIGANLCHRTFSSSLEQVLEDACRENVSAILVTGTSLASSKHGIQLVKKMAHQFPSLILKSTAGCHPHDAKLFNPIHSAGEFRDLIEANRDTVCAVGECGLDFDRNFSTPQQQEAAFRAQLDLAAELDLPVFLHERSAHAKFLEILKEYRPRLTRGGVVHCFTGTRHELAEYLKLDLHIGITGWIADDRRGKNIQECVGDIPLDRLMIETDAPFLTPRNVKPKLPSRNEPAFLPHVLKEISKWRSEDLQTIATRTTQTAQDLFRLVD